MIKPAFLAVALLAAASPAIAGDGSDLQVEVRIDDLDLAAPAGQAQLERRIHNAARQLCADVSRSVAARLQERRCMAFALQSALPQTRSAIASATRAIRLAITAPSISG